MNPPTTSDTPRTDEAYFANGATMYSLAGEMKLIERELETEKTTRNHLIEKGAKLERELAETERLRFGADADRRRLRAELATCKDASGALVYGQRAENDRLINDNVELTARAEKAEAEVDRFKEWLADPHTLHAHCLRTLTEGQIAHLFGERMTEIVNRADKAEAALHALRLVCGTSDADKFTTWLNVEIAKREKAEAEVERLKANTHIAAILARVERAEDECLEQARLLGMSGEREADLLGKLGRLESELAAIKHGHGELGKYEQLRLKNAELQAELAAMKGTP